MLSSPEFLINMKSTPDEDSSEYDSFWENEDYKITNGVTINGIYFSPFLYFHLNLGTMLKDRPGKGKGRIQTRPDFWESYLEIDNAISMAENHPDGKKGLVLVGSRRISKSVFTSAYIAHKAITLPGSENLISALNQKDLKGTCGAVDLILKNLPKYFRFPRIEDDWKNQVTLGIKSQDGKDTHIYSKICVRNFNDGLNTEAAAGLTLSSFMLEEAGKGNMLDCLSATIPCFDTDYGWRCSPIVIGTSGDMTKAQDLKSLFFEPEAHNFLALEVKETGMKHGLFIPGTKSIIAPKVEKSYSEYLGVKKGSELDDIKIFVFEQEKAKEIIENKRQDTKKASGINAYMKQVMYYPLNVLECFLEQSNNIFPVDIIQEQLDNLKLLDIKAENVELYRSLDGKVKHKFTDKKPVITFPAKHSDNIEGVIQIYEFPISNAPTTLYVAGSDPYKNSEAVYSTSLGATYIYKRIHNIMTESWSNVIVASYVGRPRDIKTWYQNTRLLLEFYNAKTLCENNDYGFIQDAVAKNDAYKFFEKTPSFLTDVHPTSTVKRDYGIHSTKELKAYYYSLIIEYLIEEIEAKVDNEGNQTGIKYGVTRILDPLLLQELLAFTPKLNVDRIIAFGLTLAMAKSLQTFRGSVSENTDQRLISYYKASKNSKSVFNRRTKRNMFKR